MGKERAVNDVDLVLRGEFADDLCAPLRIGTVVLDNDFHRAAIDAAILVDELDRCVGRLFIPAPICGADAGAMRLETDLDRRG